MLYNKHMLKSSRAWRLFVSLPLIIAIASLSLIYSGSAWLQSSNQEGPYDDVTASNDYAANISHLKDLGVFDGTECGDDNFCPDDPIDRKTLSVWLIRVLEDEDAPDLIDSSNALIDISGFSPEIQASLIQYFSLDPDQVATSPPRFSDAPYSYPEHGFIEQMVELEITGGCSQEPAKFCPDSPIPRSHMAAFLVRAFDLEAAKNPTAFVDFGNDSSTYDNAVSLRATTIDTDCGRPWRFCPNEAVTRSQMANLLARAIDWQKARAEVAVTGSDDSISLAVTYDEEEYEATASWSAPAADKGTVNHYVLQSRTVLEDFGPIFYQIVESESGKTSYQIKPSNSPNHNHLYAFRVITVYANGKRLATNEVKTPSRVRKFRDIIWDKIVEPNQNQQPWLADTWTHINDSTRFGLGFGGGKVFPGSEDPYRNGIKRKFARSLTMGSTILQNQSTHHSAPLIEEMGHVYTLTNQVGKNSTPIGIGHLYIHLVTTSHAVEANRSNRCSSSELYGDLAKMVFWGRYSDFDAYLGLKENIYSHEAVTMSEWNSCGFRLDPSTKNRVDKDIPEIAKSVFIDQEIPQWFYDTYQKSGGTIDLDKLWSDITVDMRYTKAMWLIVHHLRNEFGGYCSEEEVRKFIEGKVTGITNPWRDGGCNNNVVVLEGEEVDDNSEDANNITNSSINVDKFYTNYPMQFIRRYRSLPNKCWVVINGYAYDVTPRDNGYAYTGPGSITDLCGQDVSDYFASNNIDPPPQEYIAGSVRE